MGPIDPVRDSLVRDLTVDISKMIEELNRVVAEAGSDKNHEQGAGSGG